MVFSSLPFLFGYLPVVLAVLKLAPLHARNFCLFLVSLIFYGWSEPVYIVIMLISTFVDYYNGRMVDKYRDDRKKAKRFVWFSVIFNLSLLGFFKYADFFILNLQKSIVSNSITNIIYVPFFSKKRTSHYRFSFSAIKDSFLIFLFSYIPSYSMTCCN